jgi:penicillin-binding protein 1C
MSMKKLFLLIMLFVFYSTAVAHALPSFDEVRTSFVKSDSLLLDRHGDVLHELRVGQKQRRLDWTPLKTISPVLQEAVIQAEDRRFYDHEGVDYRSMAAAVIQGLTTESLRGASTISMQVVSLLNKNLQAKQQRKSLWQKGQQILEAWDIEKEWSKEEILETYLNLVTFRGELQGISAASRGLFGKDPHGLEQAESLLLASLIRAPNAPMKDVVKRACHLGETLGWQVDAQEVESEAREVSLGRNDVRPRMALAPHVARQLLRDHPESTVIPCTLDGGVQQFILDRLTHHLCTLQSQNVKDGAVLVVENRTGEVLAYVSHAGEPSHSRFVDGVVARRQAGSALKPFLYAVAFDRRILTPVSLLDDTPLDLAVIRGIYQPKNYDSQFKGLVTSRVALASSLNVPAVKTLSLVGIEPFLSKLRQLEFKGLNESGDFYGPSLALGSADVSLWELVNAYRTLANEGLWSELRFTREKDLTTSSRKVFSGEAVFLVSDILSDRGARSLTFGLENPLATRFWTAVKTGTSKEMRDNWCIGYSSRYTVGVWVGNFTGEAMWNVSGITGAAPIWAEVMNFLHQNEGSVKSRPPASLVRSRVQYSERGETREEEWFLRGTEPHVEHPRTGQTNRRIVYPPSGAVIAWDPDIPPELQKVFFVSQTSEGSLQWILNGEAMDRAGKTISWTPKAGKYALALADPEGNILDSVYFEVRGPELHP